MTIFLLQARVSFESFATTSTTSDSIAFAIGIGIIIFLGIFLTVLNRIGARRNRSGSSGKKLGFFTMLGIGRSYGLNKEQRKLLGQIFRINSVQDPLQALGNSATMDRYFKRSYRYIEENSITDDESQSKKLKLFSLRNIIEASPSALNISPGNITVDTPAVLAIDKDSYSVKVLSSRGQNIVTNVPRTTFGTPVRIPKGTRIALSFFTRSSNGFSFDGSVAGTVTTDFGTGLQITHNRRPKPLVKRNYRRRELNERCEFYFVNLVESGRGRRKTSKLVVGNKRLSGNILDISVGGCSMKISTQIPAASRLKINFPYEDTTISVLGQVIRSNRSGYGIIIHVKFLKVPRRAFNAINCMVFGFDEN